MEGTAHKAVWVFITLYMESVLMAFPTIELYSEVQSGGIPLEGIRVDAPDTFPWRDTHDSTVWTAGPLDPSSYSRFSEEFSVPAPLQVSRGEGVSRSENIHGYIDAGWTRSAIVPARTPVDPLFTSSTVWMETTAYPGNDSLRPYRRHSDLYR